MLSDVTWRLGLGVVLGWAALPVLSRLARGSRHAAPVEQYRALVLALASAAALVLAPLLRGWAGAGVALPALIGGGAPAGTSSVLFVAELVRPLIGAAESAWPTTPLGKLLSFVGSLWLALLAGGLLASLSGHVRLWRAYGTAGAAPPRVLERARHIAAELGVQPPPIRVADGVAAAFTYGVFTPTIILGTSSCEMSDADLQFVLRHELCHVARHDTRAMVWIDLAQRFFTGHPSLRGLAAEIRLAREARVDELAAGARSLQYARFLLTVAEHTRSARALAPSLVSMADTALERRVEMLLENRTHHGAPRRRATWLGAGGLVLSGLVLIAPLSWAQPNGSGRPTVTGGLGVEQVEQAMLADPRPLLECYGALPAPRATVFPHLSFDIAGDGRVSAGNASVPGHPALEPCLQSVLMRTRFPAPASGAAHVEFPMKLSPPYEERRAVDAKRESNGQRLPPEVIRATVRDHYGAFRDCYEAELPELTSAAVTMRFTIGRDGTVVDGETVDKTEPRSERSASLARCLDGSMRAMRFPAPKDGVVTVDYPLYFEAGDEADDGSER